MAKFCKKACHRPTHFHYVGWVMKTRSYWASQHVCRAMREMRFTFGCWWLSQRVEFLVWKLGVDGLKAYPVPADGLRRCIFRCRYSEHLR